MKSFIPWIGGKLLLAKQIVSLFPEKLDRYIEVFGVEVRFYFTKRAMHHLRYTMMRTVNLSICLGALNFIVKSCRKKLIAMLMHVRYFTI